MTARHTISHADELYGGDVFYSNYSPDGRHGLRIPQISYIDFGAPLTADTNALVAAATSTELPNAATITYTTANATTTPIDDAGLPTVASITPPSTGIPVSVFVLDVPRNVTSTTTHGSSVVAMTITITGYDVYLEKMVCTLSVAATGTSQAATGTKAFKYIQSIAITAAGDATANTLNMGFGDVLGSPVRFAAKKYIISSTLDGVQDVPTAVIGDDTAATATTGDIRGTIDFATASNGTRTFAATIYVPDPSTKELVFGVAQFGG